MQYHLTCWCWMNTAVATLCLPVIWCWQHLFWPCSNSATFPNHCAAHSARPTMSCTHLVQGTTKLQKVHTSFFTILESLAVQYEETLLWSIDKVLHVGICNCSCTSTSVTIRYWPQRAFLSSTARFSKINMEDNNYVNPPTTHKIEYTLNEYTCTGQDHVISLNYSLE